MNAPHTDDIMHSDSHALATLLLMRDIQHHRQTERHQGLLLGKSPGPGSPKNGEGGPRGSLNLTNWIQRAKKKESCPIVCEILDPRTQKVGRIEHADAKFQPSPFRANATEY